MKDVAGYHTYCSRVPVLLGNRAKIALVRMEGEPPGLEVVLRCLEKWRKAEGSGEEGKGKVQSARYRPVEVYRTTAVTNYIDSYLQRSIREEGELQVRGKDKPDADWEYDEDEVAGRIEEMKRKLIGQLIEDEGRQYQFEGGSSIYNFVGEMFKRNYRILYDNILQEMGSAHRRPPTAIPAAESSPQLQLSADYYEL